MQGHWRLEVGLPPDWLGTERSGKERRVLENKGARQRGERCSR